MKVRKPSSADNLQKMLQAAYRHRADASDGAVDSQALMRRIRHLAAAEDAPSPGEVLDRLFWRLVPATGALIAILALVAVNLDYLPDATWSMLSYETEATEIAQLLLN